MSIPGSRISGRLPPLASYFVSDKGGAARLHPRNLSSFGRGGPREVDVMDVTRFRDPGHFAIGARLL
jgi:hypothetical protein